MDHFRCSLLLYLLITSCGCFSIEIHIGCVEFSAFSFLDEKLGVPFFILYVFFSLLLFVLFLFSFFFSSSIIFVVFQLGEGKYGDIGSLITQ